MEKRIVAKFKDDYLNIPGDRLVYQPEICMIFGYNGENLVVALDVDTILSVHISSTDGKSTYVPKGGAERG